MTSPSKRGKQVSASEFRRLWMDKSMTLAQIGASLGVSGAAVTCRAARRDLPPRQMGPLPLLHDEALFAEMWAEGVKVNEMAAHFGVNEKTVRNHVDRLNLRRRGKSGTRARLTISDFQQIRLRNGMAAAASIEQAQFINAEMADCIRRRFTGAIHARQHIKSMEVPNVTP